MQKYTVKQAAKLLNVNEQRVRAKIKQGHFPHAKMCACGQSWLIPQIDVDANFWRKGNSNAY